MDSERPGFLGTGVFSWNSSGYRFTEPHALDLLDPATLESDNPWIVLAAVLERAKTGGFESVSRLTECVRKSSHALLWRAAFDLLGDAGPNTLVRDLPQQFRKEIVEENNLAYRRHTAYALYQSLLLGSVPQMLELYLGATDKSEVGIITVLLSRLLEDSFEHVAAATLADAQYQGLVMSAYEGLRGRLGSDDAPVLFGERFSVRSLTDRLYRDLRDERKDEVEIANVRHHFEAATGISCAGFYQAGRLNRARAITIIEEFLLSAGPDAYEDGARYFFGNRVPEESPGLFGATISAKGATANVKRSRQA